MHGSFITVDSRAVVFERGTTGVWNLAFFLTQLGLFFFSATLLENLNIDNIHGLLLVIAWLYERNQRGEWAAQDLALDDIQAT